MTPSATAMRQLRLEAALGQILAFRRLDRTPISIRTAGICAEALTKLRRWMPLSR